MNRLSAVFLTWVACATPPAPPPARAAVDPAEVAFRLERGILQASERALLHAEAEAAIAAGRWVDAARIVAVERDFHPDAFGPLEAEIRSRGVPEALLVLADPRRPADPGVTEARIRRAYGADLAATQVAVAGATLAQAEAVWRGVVASYVTEVDVEAAARRVVERLSLVAQDPGFRAAYGTHAAPAGTDPVDVLRAAADAGWPVGPLVVEGTDAALGGLDPWTRAVWPSARSAWEEHHAGVTLGIGVSLVDAPGGAVVVELPVVGGPAWVAGVHAGDRVVSVDGAAVPPRAAAVADRLHGPPGTPVRLGLDRAGTAVERVVERAPVPVETVTGWRRAPDASWEVFAAPGVAWVRVSAFRPETDEAFDALTETAAPRVVVLDLRGNEGGDLGAALHVADRFVADGELVRLEGRTLSAPQPGPDGELPWNVAASGHALEGVPVVVLVDGRTASAAEICAAILQRRAGATLVGEPTWGKLASQALRDDPTTGAAWQVTTGRWTVDDASARVAVDVEVPLSPAERRTVDERVLRRELPATHPDGTPLVWVGAVARRDLPRLSADPAGDRALAEAKRRLGP